MELTVPSSKSLTQRGLLIAALTPGESLLRTPLACSDSQHLRRALRTLGASIEEEGRGWRVQGGKLCAPSAPLFCGNGGTTLRFLAALSLVSEGRLRLDGEPRMRERPVGALATALESLGVASVYEGQPGYPPLALERSRPPGGAVAVDTTVSSQFASSLMMVAPLLPMGLTVTISPQTVSRPYLGLTRGVMEAFGAAVSFVDDVTIAVAPRPYSPGEYAVEGDWSAAAFLLVAGRIAGREVSFTNLDGDSPQGDRAILSFLGELDRPREHRLDLSHAPDLIAPLAVAALFAEHPTALRGAAHTRVKESDRVSVLARELAKVGASIGEIEDGLLITPAPLHGRVRLDPARDHRMAMAFGLLTLAIPDVEIADPACVEKSFPSFWETLEAFR